MAKMRPQIALLVLSITQLSTQVQDTRNEIPDIVFEDTFASLKEHKQPQSRASFPFYPEPVSQNDSSDFTFPGRTDLSFGPPYPSDQNLAKRSQNGQNDAPSLGITRIPNIGRQILTPPPGRPTIPPPPANPAQQACEQACLATNQYDPVCGSDSQTYHNEGRLTCARKCGKNVQVMYRKPCPLR